MTGVLPEIIAEAGRLGNVSEPDNLLAALEALDEPLKSLFSHDQAEELFQVFNSAYGYFPRRDEPGKPVAQSVLQRWAGLLCWLMNALSTWQPEKDSKSRDLAAILIVSQALDAEHSLWDLLPASCVPTQPLIDRHKALVRSCSISFAPRLPQMAEPVWEREAIEQFQLDDSEGDWAKIEGGIRLFAGSLYFVSLGLRQPVRCLYRCGPDVLADAVSGIRQTLVAVQIASVLAGGKPLRLAAVSTNPYIEFGAVYQALAELPRATSLSPQAQGDLTAVLLKVAQDGARWASWMVAFNTYPGRRPALQEPLGMALARVPDACLAAYVETPWLTVQKADRGQDLGRRDIARCLGAFRVAAPLERRKLLWQLAHDRWLAWNFDRQSHQTHMFAISWSPLDYAVAGFAAECLDQNQLQQRIDELHVEMQSFGGQWYETKSDFTTAWFRLLSTFQPFAHVSQLPPGDPNWLTETRTYMAFDPTQNEYAAMMFTG